MVLSTSNIENLVVNGTAIDDLDPFHYDCSEGLTVSLNGKNIGDLLNKKILLGDDSKAGKPTNWISEDNNSTKK